ncbi:MAG: hypothetical protein NEHIOOID_00983 [Holosporales bacterium]
MFLKILPVALMLAACSGTRQQDVPVGAQEERQFNFGSLKDSGMPLFSFSEPVEKSQTTVNIPLWRASLDTLNFAPIAVSDSVGGIITTEWYTLEHKSQRYKVSVRIVGKNLRADSLKLKIFKQVLKNNQWVVVSHNTKKEKALEQLILNRAKQLKVN